MKKFIVSAIALNLMLISCSGDDSTVATNQEIVKQTNLSRESGSTVDPMEDFMLYKATINLPRVASKNQNETRSAKSFALISYSNFKSFEYTVNGEVYNDNGRGNDLIADDNIYTSDSLFEPETVAFNYQVIKYDASEQFTAHNKIKEDFANGNLFRKKPLGGIRGFLGGWLADFAMGCSYSYSTAGTTLLGFSCSSGCLVIDCR
jgi:hypothetical protein